MTHAETAAIWSAIRSELQCQRARMSALAVVTSHESESILLDGMARDLARVVQAALEQEPRDGGMDS